MKMPHMPEAASHSATEAVVPYSVSFLSARNQVQNEAACNDAGDLAAHIYARSVHQKKILRVFLQAHL